MGTQQVSSNLKRDGTKITCLYTEARISSFTTRDKNNSHSWYQLWNRDLGFRHLYLHLQTYKQQCSSFPGTATTDGSKQSLYKKSRVSS